MLLAGFAVVWLAYGVGLPGWGLLRGWDITLRQYWSPFHSYGTAPGDKWPPPKIPPDRVFPGPATPGAGDSGAKAKKTGLHAPGPLAPGSPCGYCAGVPVPFNIPCYAACKAAQFVIKRRKGQ